MSKYKVIFSPLFYEDLSEIIDYIKNKLNNKEAAEKLVNEIDKEIEKRKKFPKAYEVYETIRNRKETYYRIYIKNYIIFYVVKDKVIEIRRILYSKINFLKL